LPAIRYSIIEKGVHVKSQRSSRYENSWRSFNISSNRRTMMRLWCHAKLLIKTSQTRSTIKTRKHSLTAISVYDGATVCKDCDSLSRPDAGYVAMDQGSHAEAKNSSVADIAGRREHTAPCDADDCTLRRGHRDTQPCTMWRAHGTVSGRKPLHTSEALLTSTIRTYADVMISLEPMPQHTLKHARERLTSNNPMCVYTTSR
jgi:hypothetical protein